MQDFPFSSTGLALVAVGFVLLVIVGGYMASIALRKALRREQTAEPDEFAPRQPKSEDATAFMAASMQAVIQRLREQEKELERLHRSERDRAHQSERLSEAVTRTMPTGMLLVNSAGLIQMANPAAESALGVGALAYRRYSDVLGVDSRLTQLLASCLREKLTYQREEIEHRNAAGEVRQLGVTISPTAQQQGGASGALCLLSDLTELTALQRQVRLQENMAALGEMSAGIAHEFKNALAIIAGYAQMIRSDSPPGELADSADRILKETRALTHVVTEFLRFAKPFEVSSETVEMQKLVEDAAKEVGEAIRGVTLRVEGQFSEISGDSGLLRQALLNLARNGAEAAMAHATPAEVILRGTMESGAGGSWQRVSVLDNGPGIPAESLPRLFVPFYTTKSNGTGLGLAVVQKIALQHGGRVEAANRPEGGAEFILWLPARAQKPEAVETAPERI